MPSASDLTKKQRTILDAILFLIGKGELPTVREVGALAGLRSPATVLKHLRTLESGGFISLSGKSRGIRIVDRGLLEEVLHVAANDRVTETRMEHRPKSNEKQDRIAQTHVPELAKLSASNKIIDFRSRRPRKIPLVGAIAAGHPFESFAEGFAADELSQAYESSTEPGYAEATTTIGIDPQVFCDSGEVIALKVQGDSMVDAGILDGDYAIIRRQNTVEEGEIAAVIINGEGTLKRWRTKRTQKLEGASESGGTTTVQLAPENENFEPIEIGEEDGHDLLVIGKYVGLVRGEISFL